MRLSGRKVRRTGIVVAATAAMVLAGTGTALAATSDSTPHHVTKVKVHHLTKAQQAQADLEKLYRNFSALNDCAYQQGLTTAELAEVLSIVVVDVGTTALGSPELTPVETLLLASAEGIHADVLATDVGKVLRYCADPMIHGQPPQGDDGGDE